MRLASTPFWLSVSVLLISPFATRAQSVAPVARKPAASHRANEFSLAGLRPGLDTEGRAIRLHKRRERSSDGGESASWYNSSTCERLTLETDTRGQIETIRIAREVLNGMHNCSLREGVAPGQGWKTGRGLRLGSACKDALRLYGNPDSRSPSTKGGQPLELLYYAFDWAGSDVPQVMEVVCSQERAGQPGQVVEITLAASSL